MTDDPARLDASGVRADASRLYEGAARLARIGGWEYCVATERLNWTDDVYHLFGRTPGSLLKRASIVGQYVDESRVTMEVMRAETLRSGRASTGDFEIRAADNSIRWMRLWIDVAHENGRPLKLFGAKQDVTRERDEWMQLRQRAECDPLTGLANRAVFDKRYRAVVEDGLHYGHVAALVLVDLDNFKGFNDGYGHLAGDECLREVAIRLQRVFADAMLIARIGGDEFAVLLRAPASPERIRLILRRASETLKRPIRWKGAGLGIGASIGATILGRPHLRNIAGLFDEADAALYHAKTSGRGTVRVFGDAAEHMVAFETGIV